MIQWYYRDAEHQKFGPISSAEFEAKVAAGEIVAESAVWRSGWINWTTYGAVLAHEKAQAAAATSPVAAASEPRMALVTPAASPHPTPAPAVAVEAKAALPPTLPVAPLAPAAPVP